MKKLVLIMAMAVFSAGAALSQEIPQDSLATTTHSTQTAEKTPKVKFWGYINKVLPISIENGHFYPYIIASEASLGAKI